MAKHILLLALVALFGSTVAAVEQKAGNLRIRAELERARKLALKESRQLKHNGDGGDDGANVRNLSQEGTDRRLQRRRERRTRN